jgi:hypothetical protein
MEEKTAPPKVAAEMTKEVEDAKVSRRVVGVNFGFVWGGHVVGVGSINHVVRGDDGVGGGWVEMRWVGELKLELEMLLLVLVRRCWGARSHEFAMHSTSLERYLQLYAKLEY